MGAGDCTASLPNHPPPSDSTAWWVVWKQGMPPEMTLKFMLRNCHEIGQLGDEHILHTRWGLSTGQNICIYIYVLCSIQLYIHTDLYTL